MHKEIEGGAFMYNKMSIQDIPKESLAGKKILVRVDFNVPLDASLQITDDTRIRAALPTIQYLINSEAKVILVSHLGRPKGEFKDEFKMDPVAKRLSELLGKAVIKAADCKDDAATKGLALSPGEVLLLENIRFYAGETKNDPELAKSLAGLADIFVNDAFGTAHRAHASTTGVADYLPAYAGLLIQKELDFMGGALSSPETPFGAIIGGAKVSSKIGVLKNLLGKVDFLIIGGAMAYTFFKAQGLEVGDSLCEDDFLDEARNFLSEAKTTTTEVFFPTDILVSDAFSQDANTQVVSYNQIPIGWEGVDIGPESIKRFEEKIKNAKTIVWNGPLGVFEIDKFANGTIAIAKAVSGSGAVSIIGGGDSVAAIAKAGVTDKVSHISTGGGASLEFLEGKILPGIVVLKDKQTVEV